MSEVLEDFVAPYRDQAETEEAFNELLTLATVAWNVALQPVERRQAMIDRVTGPAFAGLSREDQADGQGIIEMFIRRKDEYFAANRRAIYSFKVTETPDGFHLSVASTL